MSEEGDQKRHGGENCQACTPKQLCCHAESLHGLNPRFTKCLTKHQSISRQITASIEQGKSPPVLLAVAVVVSIRPDLLSFCQYPGL
jgi:hypothetical protein